MVKEASAKKNNCLILTDRIELLDQAGGTFKRIGLAHATITAQTKSVPSSFVNVAMVKTIKRRAKSRLDFQMFLKKQDIVIIDEAHVNTFNELFSYLNENCYVIGVTATPIRQGKLNPLCDYYTDLILGPSIELLIQDNFLAKPSYFGVSVDLSKVKKVHGEFDEKDMEKLYTETKVFEGLKHNLELHAKGLKTMIFCPNIASSLQIAKELGCAHVDGTMSAYERDSILSYFENTPGSILTNVGITTTGYDCPSIECIILYRATTSLPLYLQMIGRGSRTTSTKKKFIILDFGMNIQRFGYWHIDRIWSLKPPTKRNRNKEDVFPVKFCPGCGAVVAAQSKVCSECGYIWPVTEKERVFAELQELTFSQVQRRMSEAKSIEEMEQIRISKGYKVGYLLHKLETLEQFQEYEKLRGYKKGWAKIQSERYLTK